MPTSAREPRKGRSSRSAAGKDDPPLASTSKATLDGDERKVDDRFAELLQLDKDASDEQEDGGRDAAYSRPRELERDGEGAQIAGVAEAVDDVELDERELLARTTLPDHLLPRALVTGKKAKQPGLVYLSRLPPGMGPAQVRHLMSAYGEIGRIYLELADKEKGEQDSARFFRPGLACADASVSGPDDRQATQTERGTAYFAQLQGGLGRVPRQARRSFGRGNAQRSTNRPEQALEGRRLDDAVSATVPLGPVERTSRCVVDLASYARPAVLVC